ncbi:hypothetical protein B0H11DRAFT_1890622 [Mycena galericulata]|nr:hypothetical protein B0H11DRAFT_1890622 [Mycena galericulata]
MTRRIPTDHGPDKENRSPTSTPTSTRSARSARLNSFYSSSPASVGSVDNLLAARQRADHYERLFRNERKKLNRAASSKSDLQQQLSELKEELRISNGSTSAFTAELKARIHSLEAQIASCQKEITAVHKRNTTIVQQKNALSRRVGRFTDRVETAAKKLNSQSVKDHGVISQAMRTCIQDLVSANVPVDNVAFIVSTVAEALGVELIGDFTARSVGRIVKEGGVMAQLQIIDELKGADHVTISSDGTSHKKLQYESRHMMLDVPTYVDDDNTPSSIKANRFLGLGTAPNHTSEAQLQGWHDLITEMHKLYNESPRGKAEPADWREFFTKVVGMITDHAADQKKLAFLFQVLKQQTDRELRGERALLLLSPPQLLILICELNAEKIADAGGQEGWDSLPVDEQDRRNAALHGDLCRRYGQDLFDKLSPEQKREVDFFVWVGCCMHKDLNAHRGGNTRMMLYWEKNGLPGPIFLFNKDNDAAVQSGSAAAKERAERLSARGAVKCTELMGALLNNKDDKKGEQDRHGIYFEAHEQLGYSLHFPDTNNTRYQSHSEGAAEILVHLPIYIEFLGFIRDRKDSLKFNHMESNIYKALLDTSTRTELAVLALYGQAITHPYMRSARKAHTNILTLGPLHSRLLAHLRLIISQPALLCGPEASFETGALDGKPWERPEAIYAILALAPTLPHLQGVLVAFFEGALETWIRFTAEFTAEGGISSLSAEEQDRAWMPATNDANEGTLGSDARIARRRAPRATLEHINSKSLWKRNNTRVYAVQTLQSDADQAFVRGAARRIDGEGREKKRRLAQAEGDAKTVTEHRDKKKKSDDKKRAEERKIDKCPVIFDVERFRATESLRDIHLDHINLQIKWHRSREILVDAKSDIPPLSKLNKNAKVDVLIAALERWNRRVSAGEFPQMGPPCPVVEGETSEIESGNEEEEIGYRD